MNDNDVVRAQRRVAVAQLVLSAIFLTGITTGGLLLGPAFGLILLGVGALVLAVLLGQSK